MGEAAEAQYFRSEIALLNYSDASLKPPLSPLLIHIDPLTPTSSSPSEAHPSPSSQLHQQEQHPKDAWLPITESRNGNAFSAAFHVLNSNIGFQALMLPVAFATLGWYVMLPFFNHLFQPHLCLSFNIMSSENIQYKIERNIIQSIHVKL